MAQIVQYLADLKRPDLTVTVAPGDVPPADLLGDMAKSASVKVWRLVGDVEYADAVAIPNAAIVDDENTLLVWGGTKFGPGGRVNLTVGGQNFPVIFTTVSV